MIIFGGFGAVTMIFGIVLLLKPVKDELSARRPGETYEDVVKRARESGTAACCVGLLIIVLGYGVINGFPIHLLPMFGW